MHYCYNEDDLQILTKGFPANASFTIQRFKGKCYINHVYRLNKLLYINCQKLLQVWVK